MVVAALTLLVFGADSLDMLPAVRTKMHDAFSPGRMVVLAMTAGTRLSSAFEDGRTAEQQSELDGIRESLQESELQRRQLIIANARIRNELRSLRNSHAALSVGADPGPRQWIDFETVSARVISRDGMPDRLRELIIDAGTDEDVTQSELVVSGPGLLVDRGADHDIVAGSRVLDGAIVLGRISRVARWVSLIEPVTSPDFSARVQLIRRTANGVHVGATGILEGTDTGQCVIRGIPYTEAVSVGDEVVTADVQGMSGPALYFGRVTSAEFLSGGEWSVRVKPAADLQSVDSVAVVRPRVLPTSSRGRTDDGGTP